MDAVPANKVTHVFKQIACALGIEIEEDLLRRSVGRIVKEGRNASKLQIIESLKDAKGMFYEIHPVFGIHYPLRYYTQWRRYNSQERNI